MTELLWVGPSDPTLTKFQRAVCAREPDWSVLQCADAASALERLARRPADVVLAHFGQVAESESLFARVAETSPGAIRLALFETPALRVHGAHQVLAARGELADLHAALLAAAEVSARTARHQGLRHIVSRFHDVPSPPLIYFEIREQLDHAAGTAASMAEITSRDPALVARTLKMANSGFYARPRSIGDLSDAIVLLGGETLLGLVLAAHLYTGLPPPGLRLDSLWKHSSEVSALAREISQIEGGDLQDASHSFVAGLLHDIGVMVLLQNESARYQPMWSKSGGDESQLTRMERDTFGLSHGELGAVILMLWNLPSSVVDAVACSHAYPEERDPVAQPPQLIGRSVMAAEWLLDKNHPRASDEPPTALAATPEESLRRWCQARDRLQARRA